jgi:putative phosphoesterase
MTAPVDRPPPDPTRLGLISDTHGLLRPEARKALRGAELILHAGDVGGPEVLRELDRLAPVFAVRGNVDRGHWAAELPLTRVVEVGGLRLLLIHDLANLDRDPAEEGIAGVVCGHSHRPAVFERRGVLYLNPGSAGPRRFRLPVCLLRLDVRFPFLCPYPASPLLEPS